MKTLIAHLPDDSKAQQVIINSLTKRESPVENFEFYCKSYHNNAEKRQHEAFEKEECMQSVVSTSEKNVAWEMFLLMTIGIKGAVFYLVSSFLNGFGTLANEFLTSLTISIGLKLGDKDVIELMEGEEPIERHIQNCADKCVSKIARNSKAIGEKTDLTYQELIGYSKDFDQLVETFGHSYYNSIQSSTQRYLADYVELERGYEVSEVKMSGGDASGGSCCVIL